ncbi:hypothetical protein SBBP2_1530020 [Burkholderiales bacterium]|nr:hypothetical protein SBBP2_1530020 [Burkholderiales bacterium]
MCNAFMAGYLEVPGLIWLCAFATRTDHVVTTTRKYKDRVYRAHLLRCSNRELGVVKNEILRDLSHLPDHLFQINCRCLAGESFVALGEAYDVSGFRAHGAVQAVGSTMERLGLASAVASEACRESKRLLAMVALRILAPHEKLATTRWLHTTTLAERLRRGRYQRG